MRLEVKRHHDGRTWLIEGEDTILAPFGSFEEAWDEACAEAKAAGGEVVLITAEGVVRKSVFAPSKTAGKTEKPMAKSEISKVTDSIRSMSALNEEARQTAELASAVRAKASKMFACVRDELNVCDKELEELNALLGQPSNYPPDDEAELSGAPEAMVERPLD